MKSSTQPTGSYVTENSPVPNTGGSPSNVFHQDVANQEAFNLIFQEIQTRQLTGTSKDGLQKLVLSPDWSSTYEASQGTSGGEQRASYFRPWFLLPSAFFYPENQLLPASL